MYKPFYPFGLAAHDDHQNLYYPKYNYEKKLINSCSLVNSLFKSKRVMRLARCEAMREALQIQGSVVRVMTKL